MKTGICQNTVYWRLCGEEDPPTADPSTVGKTDQDPPKKQDKQQPEIDENFQSESDEEVKLTQKQLSKIIGGLRQKMRGHNDKLADELEKLTQKVSMTEADRERLKTVLEQSRSSFQTELEKQQSEASKLADQLDKTKKQLETETTAWRKRFEATLIDQSVATACAECNVFSPKQMRDILDRHLLVEQIVDDKGDPIEDFKVVIRTKTDEGEPVNLPVKEFITKMDESREHPNLFKHGLKDGAAASGGGSKGDVDIPTDPAKLAEWLTDDANRKKLLAAPAA